MSDDQQASADAEQNNLVHRDDFGDPIQDVGTRLIEKESYERVVDGLRVAAEACAHLVRRESEHAATWRKFQVMFDQIRRAAIQQGGLEDTLRARETRAVGSDAMEWRDARDRLYTALKQAEGGMRQLAVCHRGDLVFAQMTNTLEAMATKIKNRNAAKITAARRRGLIWMPGDP